MRENIACAIELHAVEGLVVSARCLILGNQGTVRLDPSFKQAQCILLAVCRDHVLAVVAKEHGVGNDVGANLQLCQIGGCSLFLLQRGTVTTHIDAAADDGGVVLRAY